MYQIFNCHLCLNGKKCTVARGSVLIPLSVVESGCWTYTVHLSCSQPVVLKADQRSAYLLSLSSSLSFFGTRRGREDEGLPVSKVEPTKRAQRQTRTNAFTSLSLSLFFGLRDRSVLSERKRERAAGPRIFSLSLLPTSIFQRIVSLPISSRGRGEIIVAVLSGEKRVSLFSIRDGKRI